MLAFIATIKDGDWITLVHGETRGKAKKRFWDSWFSEIGDFTEIRLRRLSELDNIPFTYDNCDAAGFHYTNPETGENEEQNMFINDCYCSICKEVWGYE